MHGHHSSEVSIIRKPTWYVGSCLFRGFAAYLKGAPHYNFQMYKALVNEITNTFNNISKEIIQIAGILRESERADLSAIIQRLQELEQAKLTNVSPPSLFYIFIIQIRLIFFIHCAY